MHIDFEFDDWNVILSKFTGSNLNESGKVFLQKTFGWWKEGNFQLQLTTSGSTGEPKSILLKQQLLNWSIETSTETLLLHNKQHVFCCLPVNKAGGAMQICRAYKNQWEITIRTASADPLSEVDMDHPYTVTSLTPFQLDRSFLNDHSMQVLKRFKTVLIGGGNISRSLRNKLKGIGSGTRIIQTYGMTETASHVALSELRDDGIFTPLNGVLISMNEEGNASIHITDLELVIESNDRIELTNQVFRILGRSDFIINSGGLKIQPEVLESRIISEAGEQEIPAFFIYGFPDEHIGQKVILIAQGKNNPVLEELVRSVLVGAEIPDVIYYIDKFSYTQNGKLDRVTTASVINTKINNPDS